AAIMWVGCLLPIVQAAPSGNERVEVLRIQAEAQERQGNWAKACDLYEELLRLDKSQPRVRERYHHCVRRFNQARRLTDPSYRKEVLSVRFSDALDLYRHVMRGIQVNYVDRDKVTPTKLFRQGWDELRFALHNAAFVQEFLPKARPVEIRSFINHVRKN